MDAETLFLENLPLVDRILAATSRRNRLTKEEAEDFASVVKVKLISNDYEVLRAYAGTCALAGYLNAVVQRAYIDHCNHLWGKWRPSAEARRLGPLAVRVDTLLHRDGRTLDEACALVPAEDREEVQRLAARLPRRVRRKVEDDAQLEAMPAREGTPESELIEGERETAKRQLARALAAAVQHLPAEDRLLVKLRLYDGVSLVSVAKSFGHDSRQIYGRWQNLLRNLRKTLEKDGYDASQVAWVLGTESTRGGEVDPSRPST
jgi:RNA polymerase sigma factor (sigma-70 family)